MTGTALTVGELTPLAQPALRVPWHAAACFVMNPCVDTRFGSFDREQRLSITPEDIGSCRVEGEFGRESASHMGSQRSLTVILNISLR